MCSDVASVPPIQHFYGAGQTARSFSNPSPSAVRSFLQPRAKVTSLIMAEDVIIRVAREQDADAMAQLAGQLGYPSTPEATRGRLRVLAAHPEHQVLVAERAGSGDGGKVVGFLFERI